MDPEETHCMWRKIWNAVLIAFGSLLLTVEGLEKHVREVKFMYSRLALIVPFFVMLNGVSTQGWHFLIKDMRVPVLMKHVISEYFCFGKT